ncbi:MAG: hypothetical protein ABMB14_09815 [Myxococcota bacterium]
MSKFPMFDAIGRGTASPPPERPPPPSNLASTVGLLRVLAPALAVVAVGLWWAGITGPWTGVGAVALAIGVRFALRGA